MPDSADFQKPSEEARDGSMVAEIAYVAPDCDKAFRFIGPGFEINTGSPDVRSVRISNARLLPKRPSLDRNGFTLVHHASQVADFRELTARVDSSDLVNGPGLGQELYAREVCDLVQQITGASLVLTVNCVLRKAVGNVEDSQPPATDVHVDVNEEAAGIRLRRVLEANGLADRKFSRYLFTSMWRAFSPPPQDWPLAICDFTSVSDEEGIPVHRVQAERPPTAEELANPVETPGLSTGVNFAYRPDHRWFYYPDMVRDEALLFKLYDSDHSRAWRVPHTSFFNKNVRNDCTRESIELRTFALFE